MVNYDFFGGVGFRLGWLSLNAIAGLGINASIGAEGMGPSDGDFRIPFGGFLEYGARLAYSTSLGSLELMYTKALRTSDVSCEKRGDVRLTASIGIPLALTMRYSEYLADVDGFITPFSAENRIAKMFWVLGGVGF